MKETRICANCGADHPIEDMFEVEGDWLCEDCADRLTVICEHCAERVTTVSMSITSAARTATALFIVTARIGIMTITLTAHPAGRSTARLFTNTTTRRTLCSTARACVISA